MAKVTAWPSSQKAWFSTEMMQSLVDKWHSPQDVITSVNTAVDAWMTADDWYNGTKNEDVKNILTPFFNKQVTTQPLQAAQAGVSWLVQPTEWKTTTQAIESVENPIKSYIQMWTTKTNTLDQYKTVSQNLSKIHNNLDELMKMKHQGWLSDEQLKSLNEWINSLTQKMVELTSNKNWLIMWNDNVTNRIKELTNV